MTRQTPAVTAANQTLRQGMAPGLTDLSLLRLPLHPAQVVEDFEKARAERRTDDALKTRARTIFRDHQDYTSAEVRAAAEYLITVDPIRGRFDFQDLVREWGGSARGTLFSEPEFLNSPVAGVRSIARMNQPSNNPCVLAYRTLNIFSPMHTGDRVFLMGVGATGLGGLGYGAYWLWGSPKASPQPK